jgi:hypothetical protein
MPDHAFRLFPPISLFCAQINENTAKNQQNSKIMPALVAAPYLRGASGEPPTRPVFPFIFVAVRFSLAARSVCRLFPRKIMGIDQAIASFSKDFPQVISIRSAGL